MCDSQLLLVRQALSGDSQALASLVAYLEPSIRVRVEQILRSRCKHSWHRARQDAADFVQQVFLALFENGGRALLAWDPERGRSLRSFVALISEHEVISALRSGRRNPFRDEPQDPATLARESAAESPSPESVTSQRQLLARVLESLHARLSPRGREMFHRLYVIEQSPEQIRCTTGMSGASIHQWRSRLAKAARDTQRGLSGSGVSGGH